MTKAKQPEDAPKWTGPKLDAALERAQKGDTEAAEVLTEAFDRKPKIWRNFQLAKQVEEGQLTAVTGDNLIFRAGIQRELQALKKRLMGPECSPLEELLVERIAACWLQVQWADYRGENVSKEDLTLAQADYRQRRQDRAHRRFLSAVKTLATVRKLALPALQVNIGEKQINVAG